MSTMPITPGPAAPAPATDLLAAAGGAVALGNVPTSESGAGFLALVQQALHLVDGQTEGAAQTDGGTTTEDGENTSPTDPQVDLSSILPFPTTLPITATPAAQPRSGTDGGEGAPAPSGAVTTSAPAATTPTGTVVAESATAGTGPSASRPEAPSSAGAVDGSGTHGARNERSGRLAPAELGAAGPGTAAPEVAAAAAPATQENQSTTPTTQTFATTSTTPTTRTTPAAAPVTTQVVDQITSLVSRGNGTHRITMKLNPEQLGEVRVVMTMREGSVHVRLAASEPQAHQALLQGSPELTRLLEVAGAGDARISVRDLSRDLGQSLDQGSADLSTASGSNTPDQSTGEGRASDRSQDEYAGTRADHPATDGAHNPRRFAAGPTGHRSNESVTSSRATGLDVTI